MSPSARKVTATSGVGDTVDDEARRLWFTLEASINANEASAAIWIRLQNLHVNFSAQQTRGRLRWQEYDPGS